MSLADQSQTWFPTSVQVTVHQARSLRVKGKNGTNDAYAIIQLAKDKFSTTVAEKCVAPVWKEEASFELPLFHPGNAERCTLYIIVMHRAQVGLDKFLGQAVVNLLDLHDHNTRKKTDWFKLVDKSKKEDKVRGEVLLDIVFMRNNMSASMFDLSMEDKPRSRISKLKDKVRGKKKDSFSDSASAIVPSVSHGLTDSEGEPDAQSLNQVPGEKKKKSKLKTLFAPKSNLQRNISQSMSTLGTLPEKNSSLSSSRSSGLNIDSPEVKKKFKFLGHKRSGSSDSKLSQGPFSLFGHKQSNSDANSTCVNGKHVYTEETEPKSGSTLSLNSSGSLEDIRKQAFDIPLPSIQIEDANEATLEQRRHQEDKERRQAEDRRLAEAKRLQEEEERSYREEEERKRRLLEEETRRKRQREEEAESRKEEEERRNLEAAENHRLEEERRQAEEKKRQEEASMSDRLTSLFGMIKKKEEKKEEVQPHTKEELPVPAPRSESRDPDPISHRSSNPFTSPLSSELPVGSNEVSQNQQNSSALLFLNRTAKVSAVKPSRLPQIPESEPADCHTPSLLSLSPATSEPTLSIVPSESPDTLSNLHSSSTSPNTSPSVSPRGSTENLSVGGSSPTMAEKKKRAPLPPSQQVHGSQNGRNPVPVREIRNPAYEEADASQQSKNISIPLPDYETLFPQKRHGVKGHTRWDHLIAEVHQRQRDHPPEFLGPEMSVDGPEDNEPIAMSSPQRESPNVHYQAHPQETKAASSKKVAAPAPPKHSRSVADSSQRQSQNIAHQSRTRSSPSAVPGPVNGDSLSVTRDGAKKVLPPTPASRPTSQMDWDTTLPDDHRRAQVAVNKEAPTAKPRQRVSDKEPERQEETPVLSDKNMSGGNIQTLSISSMRSVDQKATQPKENLAELDPFPSTELLSKDPWAQPKQNPEADNLFTGRVPIEQKLEDVGMTANDLDQIFTQEKLTDPFANFDSSDSSRPSEYRGKDEVSVPVSPTFQRKNSQRQKPALPSATRSDNKTSKSRQEPAYREETTTSSNLANQGLSAQTQADVKIPSKLYRGEDQFGADPFTVSSASSPSEPLHVVMEEPASQAGVKTPLRAWVSPTDVQPVSAQNSNGNGLALSARRPHPVKPMSTAESQQPNGTPGVKDIKGRDSTPGRIQVADPMGSGPYTQLTQEELITLVVKQQADLSRKDSKIVELEEYIDNLLVRVIDEKPAILQFLNAKPV